jgi:hypothetical protein
MEYQSNVQYASCFPPRLEDAGLEDCALPLEKIQEAFRLAAEKMHTAAESVVEVLGVQGIKENDDGVCVPDPKGANGQWGDSLVDDSDGIRGLGDSCVDTHTGGILEEGKDAVVDSGIEGKEDKLVGGIGDVGPKLGEGGCIAGDLGGLGGVPGVISSPERKTHDDDDDDEPKGPTLAGVTL